jgi:hypothetical protein
MRAYRWLLPKLNLLYPQCTHPHWLHSLNFLIIQVLHFSSPTSIFSLYHKCKLRLTIPRFISAFPLPPSVRCPSEGSKSLQYDTVLSSCGHFYRLGFPSTPYNVENYTDKRSVFMYRYRYLYNSILKLDNKIQKVKSLFYLTSFHRTQQ